MTFSSAQRSKSLLQASFLTHAQTGFYRGESPQQAGIYTYRTSAGDELPLLDASVRNRFTGQPFTDPRRTGHMSEAQFWRDLETKLVMAERNVSINQQRPATQRLPQEDWTGTVDFRELSPPFPRPLAPLESRDLPGT